MRPLPFLYESTGVETRFTNRLDPEPRSRDLFSFHRPETVASWVDPTAARVQRDSSAASRIAQDASPYGPDVPVTLRAKLQQMPPIEDKRLWSAQITAIQNLERSLAEDRPRALIQMTMGAGKTFTSVSAIYRLITHAGAKRVLFLVDRLNLGRQAKGEFDGYVTPDDGRKFSELYNVQLLTSRHIDPAARVVITTIQRLYAMLTGQELDEEADELSAFEALPALTMAGLAPERAPLTYNPEVPVETFDFIFTDECHRSIYNLWRQVLEYFDAYLIGLTATPSKQTLGFFQQNLVMEYGYEQAVADGVNVDHHVYQIRTRITESGSTVEAGFWVGFRDRATGPARHRRVMDRPCRSLPSHNKRRSGGNGLRMPASLSARTVDWYFALANSVFRSEPLPIAKRKHLPQNSSSPAQRQPFRVSIPHPTNASLSSSSSGCRPAPNTW